MTSQDFTDDERVRAVVRDVKATTQGKVYSDILDGANRQYVDLVLQGGGAFGPALLGYTYVLEDAGIRYLGIAGTSAGSLVALLLAAAGPMEQPKSKQVLDLLATLDMQSFIDGSDGIRDLVANLTKNQTLPRVIWDLMGEYHELTAELGFNPGATLLKWTEAALLQLGVKTTRDLRKVMEHGPNDLRRRDGAELCSVDIGRLALIACDVTTQTKVELPRMAALYYAQPEDVNPAFYARASCSIPFFFHPWRVTEIPQGPEAADLWKNMASYTGEIPEEAIFVDGAVMSNFPINLFHEDGVPAAPTFGVQLGATRNLRKVTSFLGLGNCIFDTARHSLDFDFITRHPDYRNLIGVIDTTGFSFFDFHMDKATKIELFVRGAQAAGRFLKGFSWEDYKAIRHHLSKVISPSGAHTSATLQVSL